METRCDADSSVRNESRSPRAVDLPGWRNGRLGGFKSRFLRECRFESDSRHLLDVRYHSRTSVTEPLTNLKVRHLRAGAKTQRIVDEAGLRIEVTPTGSRLWRFKYRYAGKEKLLSFGKYPEVTLAEARERRDQARRDLRDGNDPADRKKQAKAAIEKAGTTFEKIALEWLAKFGQRMAPITRRQAESRLRRFVFPKIGKLEIDEIKPTDIVKVLDLIADEEKARNSPPDPRPVQSDP